MRARLPVLVLAFAAVPLLAPSVAGSGVAAPHLRWESRSICSSGAHPGKCLT